MIPTSFHSSPPNFSQTIPIQTPHKGTPMPKLTSGFSLMELMIVITIIGILSAVAAPSYKKYSQRARFAEVISTAEMFKTAVSIALQQGSALSELSTGTNGIPDEPQSTKNLTSIKVENGTITATGSELVNNETYILQPNNDGDTWTISGSCLKSGFCNA